VTVLIPNKKAAARWNGALQTRLRHAPLEAFLRSRNRKWTLSGEARITDNLASATIYFVDQGLGDCTPEGEAGGLLDAAHHAAVGQAACAVSHGLAVLIQEVNSWRIAALIATARVLAPHIGPDAAARQSATSARDYAKGLKAGLETGLLQISTVAAGAVESNNHALGAKAVQLISQRISQRMSTGPSDSPASRAEPLSGSGPL
jgi:hypothetical protein